MKRSIEINNVPKNVNTVVLAVLDSVRRKPLAEQCDATITRFGCDPHLYFCNRKKGHRGPHVAHCCGDEETLAVWDNKEKP